MKDKKHMWNWHTDVYTSAVMLLIGLFLGWKAINMPAIPRRFPLLACSLICVLAVAILIRGVLRTKHAKAEGKTFEPVYPWNQTKYPLLMLVFLVAYSILMGVIGFFPATTIFIIGTMLWLGVRKPLIILLCTVGMNLFIWVLFVTQLKIPMP